MAKQDNKERSLSMNDLRGAMAEEHPERDAGLNSFVAMSSDTIEEQQPDGTYRFALNAVNEDRNETVRLQNEESNEECFRLNDIEAKGEVIAALCCKMLVKFEYTASDISLKMSELIVSCDGYSHTGYWSIDGEGHYSTAQVIAYLAANIGTHRIVAECESTKIYIKVINCCDNETYITAYGSMQITADFVTDMFKRCESPYIINDDGSHHVVNINGTSYTAAQLPVTVTQDATVTILCSGYDPCRAITTISPVSGYTNTDLTTAVITNEAIGVVNIYGSNLLTVPGSIYVAFNAYRQFNVSMGISISINGVVIPYNATYDDSISSYWYIDGNGYIIVKFEVQKSDNYNFKFEIKDNCGEPVDMSLNIIVRIKIFDELGNEVGYIDPDSLIIDLSTQNVLLNDKTELGIVGRRYNDSGKIVGSYYVSTVEGNVIELATDDLLIDARYNNLIIVKTE